MHSLDDIKAEELNLQGVLSDKIHEVWFHVVPFIIKTLEYCDDKYTIKDIYNALINKEMQLWIAYKEDKLLSYAITQIRNYPTHKRVCLLFVGGIEMYKWLHFFEPLKEWAIQQGCNTIEAYCRPGWEKILKPFGFEKIHTVLKISI